MQPELRRAIDAELKNAELARLNGNEGRARVCARRAAGLAARRYLSEQGVRLRSTSAYEALKSLATFPDLRPDLRLACRHLTLVVSEEFKLPDGIDLIKEAKTLIGGLE